MVSPNEMRRLVLDGACWLALYALLWWLLSGGGWGFGIVLAVLAAALSVRLKLRFPLPRPLALAAFAGLFLRQLLAGGWDVARRTVSPAAPVAPRWVEYSLQTLEGRHALVLSILVGLLPGTLAWRIEGEVMHLHVLDGDMPWRQSIASLEAALAALAGGGRP